MAVSEHAKSGESYEQAAKRGLLDELGVTDVKPRKLLHLRMEYGPCDRSITVLFKLVYDGEIRMDEKEAVSIRFLPVDKVKKMLRDEKDKFAFWAHEILKWYFGLPSKVKEI